MKPLIILFAFASVLGAQPQPQPPPLAHAPVTINAGGVDIPGVAVGDQFFKGGAVWAPGTPGYDPEQGVGVFATLRYGNFTYDIPSNNGLYHVVLDFVEPNKTAAGQRKFAVSVNGFTTGPLDLFALVGAHQPYRQEFLVLAGDGHIRISATSILGNAVLSGIEIDVPLLSAGAGDQVNSLMAVLADGTWRTVDIGAGLTISNGTISGAIPPIMPTPTAQVVDWRTCSGSYPPVAPATAGGKCDGIAYFAIQKVDGSNGGTYVAEPAAAGLTLDPAHWTAQQVR